MKKIIWLVIPCYNEQEVLPETSRQLEEIMRGLIKKDKISDKSKIAFVNDGSKDNTWNIITDLHEKNPMFTGINLAHNKGHQNALLAGLMTAKDYADAAISLDADLQDDVGVIEQFIDKFNEGKDVVYGVRSTRATDTVFKRSTAHAFYKLMKAMGADTLQDHADYRLMSKRALEGLAKYKEVNLFLRGIVPMIGYETDVVYYERHERFAGESKYPLKKMLSFAVDGITSCSVKPNKNDNITWNTCIYDKYRYADILPNCVAFRTYGTGLDAHSNIALGNRRPDTFITRNNRRVCRKDIYGSKRKTKIYHRKTSL